MNRTRVFLICFFLPLLFQSAGCAAVQPAPTPTQTLTPTPTFPLPEGAIIFEIEPTRKFAGTITGQGGTAIIMANMSNGGEAQWAPFVQAADKQKFTLITFNYLQPDYSGAPQAVLTILARLREVGYKRVICMGSSLGVSACGAISREPEMVGLVSIAGPNLTGVNSSTYPKLYIAAEGDRISEDTATDYRSAAEPKQLVLYKDTSMHGTTLFYSQYRDQIIKALVDFVNGLP